MRVRILESVTGWRAKQPDSRITVVPRHATWFLVIMATLQGLCSGGSGLIPDEQRLYQRIMGNYVRAVKPVVRSDLPLQVLFSIRLKQIVDLDERQQVLTTNVFIDQTWVDSALAWNASEFSDVTSLRIPADQIWKPDTFIYNNADNGTTGFVSGKFIQIRHNGAVTWPVPVRLRSSCVVKIAYFPFDYQKCMVRFGSWIYSQDFLDYTIRPDAVSVDLTTYVNNSEWELLTMTMEKDTHRRARSDNFHPFLTMTIYLRRNTFFYLFNIIVPCIMLSMLTLMTFWLPPTSGEKVTLGLSVFLAFSMFMLLIADEVPASSDAVPIIGIYLCVVMTMTSLSVILAVLVTNLYYRGTKLRSAPRWFASLFIRVLALPMCVSRDIELLATTILLPDHCRFFLIHNKFDFPTCNINAYQKYNQARQKRQRGSKLNYSRTPPATRKRQKNKNKTSHRDESQRYVFDHQDPQRLWNSHSYTSGKRSHTSSHARNEKTTTSDCTLQNTNVDDETKNEYNPVSDTFAHCDDFMESCSCGVDVDEAEKVKKTGNDHHSHCSLQQLCDNSLSPRKGLSPFIDKLFLNSRHKRNSRHLNHELKRNKQKQTPSLHPADIGHTVNDNASFAEEEEDDSSSSSEMHVVTVDMTPAGATINKPLPFLALAPPSSFLQGSKTHPSPNQRRRQLIKTMKNYTETTNHDRDQMPNESHQQNDVSHEDTSDCLSPQSSNPHQSLLKHHQTPITQNHSSSHETSHRPFTDHSLSMNDLRLQDNAIRYRKSSSDNLPKNCIGRRNNKRFAKTLSSSCTVFNTNIPFESQSTNHPSSQSLNHAQNHHHPPSFRSPASFEPRTNKHHQSAKLCSPPLESTRKLDGLEDTFCRCSESEEDVWVPYDANDDNSDAVWCLRDDFPNLSNYNNALADKDYSECDDENETYSPLLTHNNKNNNTFMSYPYNTNPINNNNGVYNYNTSSSSSSSTRRAKKQNSLSQLSVEQFMDDRVKLVLAKARLIMAEWQTIAAVIDRLLFLVALFATIFAYVFLLVIVPGDHHLDSFNMSHTLPTSTGRYDWMAT